jgi:hypothetical protein
MENRQDSVGKKFKLAHDVAFCGGREAADGRIKAGTEVVVVSVGRVEMNVEIVDFPCGHLRFWVHDLSLGDPVGSSK